MDGADLRHYRTLAVLSIVSEPRKDFDTTIPDWAGLLRAATICTSVHFIQSSHNTLEIPLRWASLTVMERSRKN
jgi:hypothetical protein